MNEKDKKKSLGLLDATFLVAGSMIGSGIFIVSSEMARDLGSSAWLLFAWFLTGIITLFGALSYGELAAMYPKAGGQYVYIREAWGKLLSFLYGWTTFSVIQTGVIAAVAVAFGKFAAVFFPVLVDKELLNLGFASINGANLLGVVTIFLLTVINVQGISYGKIIQFVFTSSKLIALTILIIIGIIIGLKSGYFHMNFANMWEAERIISSNNPLIPKTTETLTGFALMIVLSTTIINSLFSSDAWNNVTFIAGDIRNPERNLPKALFLGTFIVTLLYLLTNIAYLGLLPLKGTPVIDFSYTKELVQETGIQFASSDRVGTSAAFMIFGDVANYAMALLIMISTFGCNNGIIMAGSRLFYAMAEDNLFFKKAKKLNKHGVPAWALWIQGAWAMILCLSGSYNILIKFATFGSMIFYIITILALFKLRISKPEINRPYKAFAYPIIPILYLLFASLICLSLIVFKFEDTFGSVLLILLGIPVYLIFFKKSIVEI